MIPQAQGARLAFVVKKLEGELEVTRYKYNRRSGKIEGYTTMEDAGYLAFFPRGHYLRIRTKEDLVRYKLNYKPSVISMTGILDPATPVGKLLSAQDDKQRLLAWEDMEADVAALVRKNSGPMSIPGYTKKLPIPSRQEEVNYV